jgi:hypothetical protein
MRKEKGPSRKFPPYARNVKVTSDSLNVDLDEDISVEGLLAGKPSSESQTSLKKWLEKRKTNQIIQ